MRRHSVMASCSCLAVLLGGALVVGSSSPALAGPGTVASTSAAQAPQAKLLVSVVPTVAAKHKKWTKFRVHVVNNGDAAAKNVRVKFHGKGVAVKKKRKPMGKIKADRSKDRNFKVRLKKMKKRKATLVVRSKGAKKTRRVRVLPQARATVPASIVHRYYWGTKDHDDQGWDTHALYFVDKHWVYTAFGKHQIPQKCSKKKKHCKRYHYHARNGKLTIGKSNKKKGRVNSKRIVYRKIRYYPLTVPKKGSRFRVSLEHVDFTGCEFLDYYCHTWTDTLLMDKKGRFARTSTSLSSVGIPGSESVISHVAPDSRGRYKVLARGRIKLRYANGKKKIFPIGIGHDAREKPSARFAGLVLGSENFYYPFDPMAY